MPRKQQPQPKPRRVAHRPKRARADDSLIVEAIYEPDIERQMAGLALLLGLPYTRPTGKAA